MKINQKGMALAITLILLLILSVIGLSIGTLGIHNLNLVSNYRDSISALYASKAGVAQAIYELYLNPSWVGGSGTLTNNAVYSISFGTGTYNSTNNLGGTSTITRSSDNIEVPAGYAYIIASGTVNNITKYSAAMFQVSSGSSNSPFQYAAFGDQSVTLTGNATTGSIDSSSGSGPYTIQNNNGDVGTNGTGAAVINFSGINSMVYGDIVVGPGGSTVTSITPPNALGHISGGGTAQVATSSLDMPQVVDPVSGSSSGSVSYSSSSDHGTLAPGKYDSFSLSGGPSSVLTLRSGNYSFSNFSTSGQAHINIDSSSGPVYVYVSGNISITGGSVNNTTYKSTNAIFYGLDTCTSVLVSGGGNAYYGIYARNASGQISGNGNIYGSIIADTINIVGNGITVYDQALGSISGPPTTGGLPTIKGWNIVY